MNARILRVASLGFVVVAGLLLSAFGMVRFAGDVREAFVYLGSGIAAMSFVLLMVTLFPPAELKRAMQPGQADTTRSYFEQTRPTEIGQ